MNTGSIDIARTPWPEATPARTAPGVPADRAVKRRRVLDILDAAGRDSLLLTSHTALTWYLDGSRVHISVAGDPVAAVLVGRDGKALALNPRGDELGKKLATLFGHSPGPTKNPLRSESKTKPAEKKE